MYYIVEAGFCVPQSLQVMSKHDGQKENSGLETHI